MTGLSQEIQRLVDEFVQAVTALARDAALNQLMASMGGPPANGNGNATAPRASVDVSIAEAVNGNGTKTPLAMPTVAIPKMPKPSAGKRRESKTLEETMAALLAFIDANPGRRAQEMRTAFRVSYRVIGLPLRKLVGDGRITMVGNKRWARYYVATKRPSRRVAAESPVTQPVREESLQE